jgi:acetaldehyde dehydrogenase / alcohol dehydrogenase
LVQAIIRLTQELEVPMSLAANGIDQAEFESKLDLLSDRAFEDQCTTANPKLPLVTELAEIYRLAYKGI